MSTPYKSSLEPKTIDNAEPLSKTNLENAKARMGMVPNMYANMANSPGMLDTYIHGYTHFRESSGFNPAEQEVVFLTISRENECHYCMAAHSFIADTASKVPTEITDAIRNDNELPDSKLAALHQFSRTMMTTHGHPNQDDVSEFLSAGYTQTHVLGIILALSVKTISNYSNHVFDTTVDAPFAGRTWQVAQT